MEPRTGKCADWRKNLERKKYLQLMVKNPTIPKNENNTLTLRIIVINNSFFLDNSCTEPYPTAFAEFKFAISTLLCSLDV